jgi:hypothetical protein
MEDDELSVLELAENKLKDLSLPFSAAAPLASLPPLAQHLLATRAALGGLGEVPPLPPSPSAADAHHFAAALGFPYALEAAASEDDRVAALLDFMASELQSLRLALAVQRREARAAEALARSASLETELHSLLRALSIPPLRGDVAATHPEKVLAQVRGRAPALPPCPSTPPRLTLLPPSPPPLPSLPCCTDQGQGGAHGGAPARGLF